MDRRLMAAVVLACGAGCGPPPEVVGPPGWQTEMEDCESLGREEDRFLCEVARRGPQEERRAPPPRTLAPGDPTATMAAQLARFASGDPEERRDAIENMALIAAFEDASAVAVIVAALVAGEDPAPQVRAAAVRLGVPPMVQGDRADLARTAALHVLRGERTDDTPPELEPLDVRELVRSRLRRQTLAAAAVLALALPGPADMAPEHPGASAATATATAVEGGTGPRPWTAFDRLLDSEDPEVRLVTIAAVHRGLDEAATVETTSDPNPVVDAIVRGQGDRLRVMLTLEGAAIEPGRAEPLFPAAARAALANPLDRALAAAFHRIAVWRIPGGDDTSARARIAEAWDDLFAGGFADAERTAADAGSLGAAAWAADCALAMELRAETTIECLSRAELPGAPTAFPRTVAAFRDLASAAAGTDCQDDDLILLTEDAAQACAATAGEAAAIVAEFCDEAATGGQDRGEVPEVSKSYPARGRREPVGKTLGFSGILPAVPRRAATATADVPTS